MIENFLGIYILIGMALSFYWIRTEYKDAYEKKQDRKEVEEPVLGILFVLLTLWWPFKLFDTWKKNKK